VIADLEAALDAAVCRPTPGSGASGVGARWRTWPRGWRRAA